MALRPASLRGAQRPDLQRDETGDRLDRGQAVPRAPGVDWQGTIRAFLTNTTSGQVEQGASTIDQQYVKNYLLHVIAKTDAERRAAIETTPARKIREIRMALTLDDQLTKDEILTRYLNLVPFGNGSFGIQDAAQTYFASTPRT